jgi:hypothetical protein
MPRLAYRGGEQHCDVARHAVAEIDQRAHLRFFHLRL